MEQEYSNTEEYSNLSEINTRIRILESKYALSRERMFLLNQNMIDEYKKLNSDIKSLKEDLKEIKESIFNIKQTTRHIIEELDSFAKKENLNVVEKYINIWNPLHFMTQEEVEKLINEKIKNGRKLKRSATK